MKEQKIKMIALDLDGTLLSSDKSLGEISKRVLTKLHKKGVIITLSTGRVFHHAQPVSTLLGLPAHLICVDGAYILPLNYDEPITKPFSSEQIKGLLGLLNNHLSHVYLILRDRIWCRDCKKAHRQIFGWGHRLIGSELDLSANLEVLQVIYLNKTAETAKLHQLLGEGIPTLSTEMSYSLEPGYSQITIRPPGINKGSGLETLADLLQVNLEETVVFGDWLNDLPMLEKAGLAVTPANSMAKVKAAADIVSAYTSDEDFVGRELERLLSEKRIIA